MIGSSDGQQYEDTADHYLGKAVDFDPEFKGPKITVGKEPDNSDSTFKSLGPPIVPGTKIRDPQGAGRDVRVSQNDYDMDAWQKANPDAVMAPGQHYPDTYKLPNHPTFSNESVHHGQGGAEGGQWDQQGLDSWQFTPGKSNLEHHSPQELRDYFNRVEPGNTLNLPEAKIDTSHDVKSASVASKDSNTVYIDPSIPDKFHPFLAVHEETEKHLMAQGMSYNDAHIRATLAERQAVVSSGQNWKTYTDAIDPFVAKTEKGDGKNPPPDPHVNIEDSIGHHADKASVLEKADMKIASDADERPKAGQQYAMEDTNRRNTLYNMGVEMSGGKGGGGYSRGGNVQPLVRKPANRNLTVDQEIDQEYGLKPQPSLEQKPWTSKQGNPWGMSDKDYMQWRGQPENELAAARWEKNNPSWKGDMAARTDRADLAKFGVKHEDMDQLPPEQIRYIKQAIRQKVDKQFGEGSFDRANSFDEKYLKELRQGSPKESLEKEIKGLNESFDKTIAQLHKDFPDLPSLPTASNNMSLGEKAAFYGSLAAALGGSALIGAMKAMGLLDKKPAEDKTLGPRSMSDEQPDPVRPGQQYAMEDTRIRVPPEGPGRPSTGGGSSRVISSENAQASAKFRDAVEIARQGATSEKVDRPAIKVGDEIFEGKPGESHYHVMVNNGKLQKMPGKDMDRMESGWMTDKGRYVDREEAMEIAKKSEQIKEYPKRWADDDFTKHELISEDLTAEGGRGPDPRAKNVRDSSSEADMASFLKHLDNFIPRKK